jgi:nicotinamide-nucleotide amidase
MSSFLNADQQSLAAEIASLLTARGETVAVAETTTGGLISAALLSVPGASGYYAGGGVVYNRAARIALAGVPPEQYANYQGTTPELLSALAEAMRQRLGATWAIAESGLAGPTGGRSGALPGHTTISVAGPVARTEAFDTGLSGRAANMVEFTTHSLHFLLDTLLEAQV